MQKRKHGNVMLPDLPPDKEEKLREMIFELQIFSNASKVIDFTHSHFNATFEKWMIPYLRRHFVEKGEWGQLLFDNGEIVFVPKRKSFVEILKNVLVYILAALIGLLLWYILGTSSV